MGRTFRILAGLVLAGICFGQGFILTPPPYWFVVAPPGPLASRPATCTQNFHVYICNGAGCGTNGEYHYCTALNTWTVASGADDFVKGAAAQVTPGAVPYGVSTGTLTSDPTKFYFQATGLGAATAPTLTVHGTAGTTTCSYRVAILNLIALSDESPYATTTVCPDTLSGTDYVAVATVAVAGSVECRVYKAFPVFFPDRQISPPGFACGATLNDTGLAMQRPSAPTIDFTDGLGITGNLNVLGRVALGDKRGDYEVGYDVDILYNPPVLIINDISANPAGLLVTTELLAGTVGGSTEAMYSGASTAGDDKASTSVIGYHAYAYHAGSGVLDVADGVFAEAYNVGGGTITDMEAIYANVQFQNGSADYVLGVSSYVSGGGTATEEAAFKSWGNSVGASGHADASYGYHAMADTPVTGTIDLSALIYLDDNSAGGTEAYNFYSAGATAMNYFAGRVRFGGSSEPTCMNAADLTVDVTDNKKVTSATYTFVAGDVSGQLSVVSGVGWTPGTYTVVSVVGGAAVLDSSPAATSTIGGVYTFDMRYRGVMVRVNGGAGVADTLRQCTKANTNLLGYAAI